MKEMKQRYSAVDLTDLAIGILILGIVVVVGARILINVRDNTLTGLDVKNTLDETGLDLQNETTLSNAWGISINSCVCNATDSQVTGQGPACGVNETLVSDNYTVSISNGGTISIINATKDVYTDVSCNYSWYDTSSPDWALPNEAAAGIAEYGNWFDIIVIVGVAGLILALIFLAFGNRQGQEGGVVY